jgi:hypothetical protein
MAIGVSVIFETRTAQFFALDGRTKTTTTRIEPYQGATVAPRDAGMLGIIIGSICLTGPAKTITTGTT